VVSREKVPNCTGCAACQNACGLGAIELIADREGFVYPHLDQDKCIGCGKCAKSCPLLNGSFQSDYFQPDVYAAWNRDDEIRVLSTSGGVFSALAKAVINQGGYVAGAFYDEGFHICHGVISNMDEIPRLRQSKYAQSWIGDTYKTVRELLKSGKMVMFCGTPCQSAGLQQFLGKKYEKLYCCDFICRGVVSPKVYENFLQDMKPDQNVQLTTVHFKNKDFGWNRFSTKLTFEDGSTYHKDRGEDYYMRGYLQHNLYLRPSCHQCKYKTLPRVSDISLGDFWGISNYDPTLDNEKGTSVILVNSTKGRSLLALAQGLLVVHQRSIEEVLAGNSCLLHVAAPGKYREYFFKKMDTCPFDELILTIDKKSQKVPFPMRIRQKLGKIKRRLLNVKWGIGDA
jgi:coenzyme F420-reducing hydrogenase beta subunit